MQSAAKNYKASLQNLLMEYIENISRKSYLGNKEQKTMFPVVP